ncbi:hypothetical protein MNV49_003441 [Pseudohyphozyma bogoriensis]|nr:hypothetical protein MNV49_003441 [Pseudohyphozyma bogoriensis]
MPTPTPVPVVALGVYRHVAAFLDPIFESTPYALTSILQLQERDQKYNYSPQNLAVVLRTLNPSPKAFIVGLAIEEEMWREAKQVWDEWVEEVGQTKGVVFKLREQDWRSEIMRTLDDRFRS